MRLDKYLKVSRLIKRRTVANDACDAGRVLINDKVAKAGANVKVGDVITLQTTYGIYEYTVRDMKIVDPNDKTAYDLNAQKENLILYTCYPFNMLGFSKQRYFVYADFTSGPVVNMYE